MDHIAIMKKEWGLIPKILSGEKTVESRWYKARFVPWNKVKSKEILYFKNSGEPVTVKSEVTRVRQYDIKNNAEALEIMKEYALEDLGTVRIPQEIIQYISGKKYAIFVFFDSVKKIESFNIDKTGFGAQAAWLCVEDINKIKR